MRGCKHSRPSIDCWECGLGYCEHSRPEWDCWECDDERADAARWKALSWHVRARETLALRFRGSRLGRLWRRLRPRRAQPRSAVSMASLDSVLRAHYRPEDVEALAREPSPLWGRRK